jgi:hypothetical protein
LRIRKEGGGTQGRIMKIIREVNVWLMTITGGQEDYAYHVKEHEYQVEIIRFV